MTAAVEDRGVDRAGSADRVLRAVLEVSGALDLDTVLERVVASAADLTGARYAALGVVGSDGELGEFVTSGLDPSIEAAIADRRRGRGLLGLRLSDSHAIRIDDLARQPEYAGLSAGRPPMRPLLAVPIRIRGTVFGTLYLTEKLDGEPFTELDERLVVALTQGATPAIENARAYGVSERRRRLLEASAALSEALQPPMTPDAALQEILVRARALSGATTGVVVQFPSGEHPVIAATDTTADVALAPTLRRILEGLRIVEDRAVAVDIGLDDCWAQAIPVLARLADPCALVLITDARPTYEERETVLGYLDQAGLALDRVLALTERHELAVMTERARIGRDLHDVVIQRLFACGLKLQSLLTPGRHDDLRAAVDEIVADLDATIHDIRTTIFDLQRDDSLDTASED